MMTAAAGIASDRNSLGPSIYPAAATLPVTVTVGAAAARQAPGPAGPSPSLLVARDRADPRPCPTVLTPGPTRRVDDD
jgi:hypothetical protein